MIPRRTLAGCALSAVAILSVMGLAAAFSAAPARGCTGYQACVGSAVSWLASSVPKGSGVLSITEPDLYSAGLYSQQPVDNGTWGTYVRWDGLTTYYDPFAAEAPSIAALDAKQLGAEYVAVTDLQAEGYSRQVNFAWYQVNASSLGGASLAYSNQDVRVYCVVSSCP